MAKRRAVLSRLRTRGSLDQGEASNGGNQSDSQTTGHVGDRWLPTAAPSSDERARWMSLADDAGRGPDASMGAAKTAPGGSWLPSDAPEPREPSADPGGSWLPGGKEPPPRAATAWLTEVAPTPPAEADQPTTPAYAGGSWLPDADEPPTEVAPSAPEAEQSPLSAEHAAPPPEAEQTTPAASGATVAHRPQTRAVEAYCAEVCQPETASAAASDSLGSFAGGDDADLLRHTRVAAAKHVTLKPGRRRWRQALAAERDSECEATPALLAARDGGELEPGGAGELERHLASCATCQAHELRARRAERAFAAVIGGGLAAEIAAAHAKTASAAAELAAPAPPPELAAPPPPPEPAAPPEPAEETAVLTPPRSEPDSEWLAPAGAAAVTAAPAAAAMAAAPEASAEAAASEAIPADVPSRPRITRRTRIGALVAAAAVAAIALVVGLALSSGSSKNHPATSARAAAPVTTPAPVHSQKPRAAARTHHRTAHRAVHRAAKPAAAPATASAAPSPSVSSSAPATSTAPVTPSPPASNPTPSAPSTPAPVSQPAPQPSVSIQQPSLGATSGSQGLGTGH